MILSSFLHKSNLQNFSKSIKVKSSSSILALGVMQFHAWLKSAGYFYLKYFESFGGTDTGRFGDQNVHSKNIFYSPSNSCSKINFLEPNVFGNFDEFWLIKLKYS